MKISVINKYHLPKDAKLKPNQINVMRPSVLGNPFPIVTDRNAVIDQFDIWLEDQLKAGKADVIDAMEHIAKLAMTEEGVELVCCCKPQRCHGDVIARYITNALNGRDPWDHPALTPRPSPRFITEAGKAAKTPER